jgi:hypothetical protein
VVRPDEIGAVASIGYAAARNGAAMRRMDLNDGSRHAGRFFTRAYAQLKH